MLLSIFIVCGLILVAAEGAEEAAKELGGVEIIYTGPTDTNAEGRRGRSRGVQQGA